MREGDRIIEVNGVNVTEETHHQVVNRIKARPGQVDLLLVDKATDLHYAGLGMVIRGDMPQIHTQETPESSKGEPTSCFTLFSSVNINYDIEIIMSPSLKATPKKFNSWFLDRSSVLISSQRKNIFRSC